MDWFLTNNRDYPHQKIVIIPSSTVNDETGREVDAVELAIGHEDKMLEDCKRIKLTKREWKELRQKINGVLWKK